jgi:(R,R)-butanediol dehydrogenase / meso-butanediol dehydrogenase / diacetyl reductase
MRAAVFRGIRQLPVEEIPDPVPGDRDIVIRVKACGVCGTDLSTYTKGLFTPVGQVMGHEFSGEVVHVGARVAALAVGDRVTGLPIQPCGDCRRCREGAGHLCEVWTTRSIAYGLPGAFAELLLVPDAVLGGNVHRLPENVTYEDGALAEPLSVATHAVRRAQHRPGEPAVVLGLGPIGLHTAQILRARGAAPVIGVDQSPLRRAAAESLGITTVDGEADLRSTVDELVGPAEVLSVFEASGAAALVRQAVRLVRPGGQLMVVALYQAPVPVDLTLAVQKELTVRTSAMVTPEDFRDSLAMLAAGEVAAQPLVTQRRPLAEIDEAFQVQLEKYRAVKVLVTG